MCRHISSALEKEIIISKQLLNDIEKKKAVSGVTIDVQCHVTRKAIPSDHMVIMVYNNGCSGKTFNEFTNYFLVKTPSILKLVFANAPQNTNLKI